MSKQYTPIATKLDEIAYIKSKLADREWRMDNLYWVEDKFGKPVPFVRNESQMTFWNEMWFMNLILKDRQRGFSTLIAMFILDYCLFNSHSKAGIVDITLPDAKKKLGKIKFAYERLPGFLKEQIELDTDSKSELEFSNGSSVYVGTSHRGGTLQVLHISEMGKIAAKFPERAREIRTGALNTLAPGNFIFSESTAEGSAGDFYEDCMEAQRLARTDETLSELDYKFHFFGWWMGSDNEINPAGVHISKELEEYFEKLEEGLGITISANKRAWYAKKKKQQREDMKREFPGTPEEAFEAAIEGAYLGKTIAKMEERGKICAVPMVRGVPVNTGWDYGLNDKMTIWLHQRVEFEDRAVGYIEGTDEDVIYYWAKLQRDYSDVIWGNHFVPHDFAHRRGGTAKDPASPPRTLEDILEEAGMQNIHIVPITESKIATINEVRAFLPSCLINKKECEAGLKCLKNFKREWDGINGCWKDRPRHDWAMHGYDGLESLVRGLNAYGAGGKATSKYVPPPPPNWRAA